MSVRKKIHEKHITGFGKKCFMRVDHFYFWVYCFYIQYVYSYSYSCEMRRFCYGR
nr:MAG TPA: hypothetical protein [Caudoviricetes sp.]